MRSWIPLALALVAIATPGAAPRLTAEEWSEERLIAGHLCEGEDGLARIGRPIAYLGMYGRMAVIYEQRLSPELARRFAPLVNRIAAFRSNPEPEYYFEQFLGRPAARIEDVPRIQVCMEATTRLIKNMTDAGHDAPGLLDGSHIIYSIDTARLLYAESVTEEWLRAWRDLDQSLRDVVRLSLAEAGAEKRTQLEVTIERGSQALQVMVRAGIPDGFGDLVRRIEPTARAVRIFQREKTRRWGGVLESHARCLGLTPRTPFPPLGAAWPLLAWAAEADSPEELIKRVHKAGGEAALEEEILSFRDMRPARGGGQASYTRPVRVWQAADLSPADFERLRREAREKLAEKTAEGPPPWAGEPVKETEVAELGAVVSAAPADVLTANLVLAGMVIDRTLPGGSPFGLEPGDLIPAYDSVYSLVMWPHPTKHSVRLLVDRAKREAKLEVFRRGKRVTLARRK